VLSVLGGDLSGQLVGMAPEAEYLLAKTEDVVREEAVEEHRWIAALEWADSLGAQVLNSSLGYNVFDDGTGYAVEDLDGRTALATLAAELAVERGMVVVASAGNEGDKAWRYVTVPADGEGVIAVGAVAARPNATGGYEYTLAPYSSRGPTADGRIKPDVVAPGVSVVVVSGRAATADELPGAFWLDQYLYVGGTSYAAPLVSGVCALLLQAGHAPAQIAQALRQTAVDLGPAGADTLFGWGLVDAVAASGLGVHLPELAVFRPPFPNPARIDGGNATVHFPLELPARDEVGIDIYDFTGALVDRVPPVRLEAGYYTEADRALRWSVPEDLSSGVYIFLLRTAAFTRRGTVAILRRG
jgi:subtilisin family serine protease